MLDDHFALEWNTLALGGTVHLQCVSLYPGCLAQLGVLHWEPALSCAEVSLQVYCLATL